MPRYSQTNLARAAVTVLDTYKLSDVTAALAQAMKQQRLGLDAALMASQLASQLYKSQGHLAASVISAHPVSAALKKHLTTFLAKLSGASSVIISYELDPKLLGGLIISTPVGVLNISIKQQLNQLHTLAL